MDKRNKWPFLLLPALWVLALALAGCGGSEVAPPLEGAPTGAAKGGLAFQTVAQGESLAENSEAYNLVILDEDAERAQWVALMNDPAAGQALAAVDLSTQLLVGAISSLRPSGGYSITITEMPLTETGVTVRVTMGEPEEGQMTTDMIGQPYHFVTVLRSELPAGEGTRWVMQDADGNTLAETSYP